MNTLDELFKNKLEDHSITPSFVSWQKVEANLSKKNNIIFWVKVAAALLLASSISIKDQTIKSTSDDLAIVIPTLHIETKSLNQICETQKENITLGNVQTKAISKGGLKSNQLVEEIIEKPTTYVEVNRDLAVTREPNITIEATLEDLKQSITFIASSPEKPTVIEFTIGEPLQKESIVKSKTNLRKVVDFAVDVKNGEENFGLRQAKDDLLAFNFRKERSKKQ